MISFLIQARKSIPMDRLEHLKSQLSSSTNSELISQLEEVIAKLEPPDSASSSRRSSISSHVRRSHTTCQKFEHSMSSINTDISSRL